MKPDRIKKLRRKLKLTQEEFGRRVGVSWRTVARWESGESAPRKNVREKIELLERRKNPNLLEKIEEIKNLLMDLEMMVKSEQP
jgi:DNA-binding transcriptional regulator YiaG